MLIILSEDKEYFKEVKKAAEDAGLIRQFNDAMQYLHLYGCGWEDPDAARVELTKDFAPLSFGARIQFRQSDGSYKTWACGGLIYQGPDIPADGSSPSFTVSLNSSKVGWFLHT